MSNFDNFLTVNKTTGQYLLFIKNKFQNDEVLICATDGLDVWQITLNKLHEKLELIRQSLLEDSVEVSPLPANKLKLKFTSAVDNFELTLTECSALVRRNYLKDIIFGLSEKITKLNSELLDAKKKTADLQEKLATKNDSLLKADNPFKMPESKKSSAKSAPYRNTTGMSIINPNSRKRKLPKGVQYD